MKKEQSVKVLAAAKPKSKAAARLLAGKKFKKADIRAPPVKRETPMSQVMRETPTPQVKGQTARPQSKLQTAVPQVKRETPVPNMKRDAPAALTPEAKRQKTVPQETLSMVYTPSQS